jgi:hypothetical protein
MNRSWGTFFIALVYKKYVTPEQAISLWTDGKIKAYERDPFLDNEIVSYRKLGMTWKAIGDLVGMTANACFKRANRSIKNIDIT